MVVRYIVVGTTHLNPWEIGGYSQNSEGPSLLVRGNYLVSG